jgi:preflagellin peptidase FlaK
MCCKMNEILDGIRVILCISFFVYASWSDLKTREVSNKVWVIMAPFALTFTLLQFVLFNSQSLTLYFASFAITAALSIGLFYVGAFGGADAKALICLALALPLYPKTLFQFNAPSVSPIFPLTVFSNAVLSAAFSVVYAVLRNFSWRLQTGRRLFDGFENELVWRKILAFLTGYKVKIAELETGYMYPLEDIKTIDTGEIERKLLVLPKDEERETIIGRILNAKQEGKLPNEVWATLGLPLLIFITLGLIVGLIMGDIIWLILSLLIA